MDDPIFILYFLETVFSADGPISISLGCKNHLFLFSRIVFAFKVLTFLKMDQPSGNFILSNILKIVVVSYLVILQVHLESLNILLSTVRQS